MKRIMMAVVLLLACIQISASANSEGPLTRIELVAEIVFRQDMEYSASKPVLADLPQTDKYYPVAVTAMENGIISGYGGNIIKPFAPISREDALVILCRAYKVKPAAPIYIDSLSDYGDIAAYAIPWVSAAVHNNIVRYARGEAIGPKENITRSELSELLESFERYGKTLLNFYPGYPKEAQEKSYGKISVSLKVTRPCIVYYKLLPSDSFFSSYRPEESEIDKFISPVSAVGESVDIEITPEDGEEYNLYIMAVDENGSDSVIEVIPKVTAHPYPAGRGTKESPYLIYNEEQLKNIKYYPDSYFRLESDIVLSGPWQPIEINTKGRVGFSGELDGNYHKITNVIIKENNTNTGLFRELHGGRIKRLYIDASVEGGNNTGIIAGRSAGGSITECFVTGTVKADGNNAGAIVGVNEGVINDCVAAAYMVEATNYAGGAAGANIEGEIINCLSAVYSVSADMYASGIAGINSGGIVNYNVCANMYADDILTTKSGRVTTNKHMGSTFGNYCYDKMFSDNEVVFARDSHDGLEVSWEELTSIDFYKNIMGWNTKKIWGNKIDSDFRLIRLRGFGAIDMIKGITMYAPIKISNKAELLKVKDNLALHYILVSDISLEDTKWEMIAENGSPEEGFSGTFDGNNHVIRDMHIGRKTTGNSYGMFGTISSGTVRNLNLRNLTIEGESLAGGIAAENYGYIENCSVSGRIYALRKDNMLSAGGICGNNYGIIEDVSSSVKIRADGEVLTIGGVVANNEGLIDRADFSGRLNAELNTEYSNAVAGGICGINTTGMIYNSFADAEILAKAGTNYIGGIVGITNGGEVYKTSATGQMTVDSKRYETATAYTGGIVGLSANGIIMNSFSDIGVMVDGNAVYAGGISGYNMGASIQNTYSTNEIDVTGKSYSNDAPCFAGGLCGFSESGFILDSVSANKKIGANGIIAEIGSSPDEQTVYSNNYSCIETKLNGEVGELSERGTKTRAEYLNTAGFFFKPIAEGGVLGWNEGDVWYADRKYSLPLLAGVKGQEKMKAEGF